MSPDHIAALRADAPDGGGVIDAPVSGATQAAEGSMGMDRSELAARMAELRRLHVPTDRDAAVRAQLARLLEIDAGGAPVPVRHAGGLETRGVALIDGAGGGKTTCIGRALATDPALSPPGGAPRHLHAQVPSPATLKSLGLEILKATGFTDVAERAIALRRRRHLQRQAIERTRRRPDDVRRDMSIPRRRVEDAPPARGKIGVAEQRFDDADVGAVLKKMRREAVAKGMQRDPLAHARVVPRAVEREEVVARHHLGAELVRDLAHADIGEEPVRRGGGHLDAQIGAQEWPSRRIRS